MKKLTAIFFFLVVVFNFYGYRLLIAYLQSNHTVYLEKKLDRLQYNDDELISIKTTLNLPYYSSSPQFERAYGSVNIGGIVYEYVKKRVYHDTLELLCIRNHGKSKLQQVSNELTKIAADGQASLPSGKTIVIKISLPDYCNTLQTIVPVFPSTIERRYRTATLVAIAAGYIKRLEMPPQSILA